jgi:hypothetical protein
VIVLHPSSCKESPTAGPVTPALSHPGQSGSSKRVKRQPTPGGVQAASDARHRSLGLALILVASFMVVLDFSIVNVALPSIEGELGLAASAVQWVITGYAITFGGLLILGGPHRDRSRPGQLARLERKFSIATSVEGRLRRP